MPLLSYDAPLPARPRRVVVAGTSGSGKTTVARSVGAVLGLPHVEIDALFHGPGWAPRPSFLDDVRALVARPEWVTEWQYDAARPLLEAHADLAVWLDLPRRVVVWQVARRTVVRRLRRAPLWHGNVEPPMRTFLTDRDHIVRWAWRTHGYTAGRVSAVLGRRPELPVVRLRSQREVSAWLAGPLSDVAG